MQMKRNYYSSDSNSSGLSILGVLQIVFIVLKLCGLIHWSWWAVLMPLWIELGLLLIVVAIIVGEEVYWHKRNKRNK